MVALRTLPLLFLVSVFLRGQGEDIYQRVRLRLGEAAVEELRAKNFSRLEQLFAEAKPADDNERAEVLALSGAVAFLNGKMNAAVVSFHESEKIRPPKEEDRFTLAMALVRLGDETEARGILSSLAADHPNSSIYWYWLGAWITISGGTARRWESWRKR
jgi:Flp pilus assembly protein TadD